MTYDNVKAATARIRAIGRDRVLIGIPAESPFRKPEGEGQEPTNAQLGWIHEFGSPAANIPARPFLLPGVASVRQDIANRLERGIRATLRGNFMDVDKTLHAIGLTAQNAVRRKITEGPFIPLSPVTLAKRRAKGRKGTKPLIDTAQLRASVTYVIRAG